MCNQVDVTNAVHGLIRAQDPCDFASLRRECVLQVVGFEKLTTFAGDIMIDHALNRLLWDKIIEIESSLGGSTNEYTICFRNK